jgi:hypothetical protein
MITSDLEYTPERPGVREDAEPELRAENSSGVGWYAMSGEDALSDRPLRSSSLFTLGKGRERE